MARLFSLRLSIALLAVVMVAAPAAAAGHRFVSPLSGGEEVPPVPTRATGVATYKLSGDGTELSFRLIVANIQNVTQAHIHCGAEGVNGPVVAFLYGFELIPGRTQGVLSEGTLSAAEVIARPDSPACPGGVANFDELLAKMRSGDTYTNVHTTQFPGGEIRGQIR